MMKKFTALATSLCLGLALVGCGQETKVEKKETVVTPGGTTTETTTKKVESKGENPPATSTGEKVEKK